MYKLVVNHTYKIALQGIDQNTCLCYIQDKLLEKQKHSKKQFAKNTLTIRPWYRQPTFLTEKSVTSPNETKVSILPCNRVTHLFDPFGTKTNTLYLCTPISRWHHRCSAKTICNVLLSHLDLSLPHKCRSVCPFSTDFAPSKPLFCTRVGTRETPK